MKKKNIHKIFQNVVCYSFTWRFGIKLDIRIFQTREKYTSAD